VTAEPLVPVIDMWAPFVPVYAMCDEMRTLTLPPDVLEDWLCGVTPLIYSSSNVIRYRCAG
jgi:hypothetical protein